MKKMCGPVCFFAQRQIRTLYRAAVTWKDVLDNPFYEKYKKQLETLQG